jgi:cAMP phosphodiesterase
MSQSEKAILIERAEKMGMKVSPNIGIETLREKIHEKLRDDNPNEEDELEIARKECIKLIRVSISCLDSSKVELEGEFFQAANGVCNVKRFIPFNTDWHIEKILYDTIKEKKMQKIVGSKKDSSVNKKTILASAYSIEVLESLTQEALDDLAKVQSARQSIED